MNYTLHQLQIFCKVCEYQSITQAADALHLTQPAVSIQLKNLQNNFDVPLTEVMGRQLYVTDFGRRIEKLAVDLLNKAEAIDQAGDLHRGLLTGSIKIAAVSTAKYVFPYFLAGFMRRHPGVKFTVEVTNKATVVESLRANAVDFAIVSVLPEKLRLHKLPLLPNELYLMAAHDYPDLPPRMTPKRLGQFPLIYREPGSATRQAMERFLKQKGVSPQRSMQLASNEAVKQGVLAGLGLSVLPLIGSRTDLAEERLRIVPVHGLPIRTQWNLVYGKGKRLSPAAAALSEHVQATRETIVEESFGKLTLPGQ